MAVADSVPGLAKADVRGADFVAGRGQGTRTGERGGTVVGYDTRSRGQDSGAGEVGGAGVSLADDSG